MKNKIKIITIILSAVTLISVAAFSVSAIEDYTVKNVTDIQKHIANIFSLSENKQKEYDFDNNGEITISDATYLQKILVGANETTYPTRLSLDISEITLGESEVYKFLVNSDVPNFPFTFSSSNPNIALVDKYGSVVALSSGTATITCSTANGLTARCEVTVKKMAQSVTLNKTNLTLGIGETYDLNSSVPSGTAAYYRAYSTNNKAVVSVEKSGGLVTAKEQGTATITCTLANGVKATCTVTVGTMAQSITLNKTNLTLGVGEEFDLNSYIPENTFAYFRCYSSSNSDVASVAKSGGLVTAKKQGTATITCKMSNGVKATCTITVKAAPTSVSLNISSKTLKVGEDYIISESTNSGSYSYNFTWSSSNTKVATVKKTSGNKAQISPKMQGVTTITIKTYNGKTASCKITIKGSKIKCLDVSDWQYSIDFNKVKADGYDYVIIRAGYGRETYQKDARFEENYKKAKAAGLKVGAYWYAYATSKSEALKEANACLYCIKGKTFDLPVYYDVEEWSQAKLSKTDLTNLISGFCSTLESNDYQAGVYATNGMFWNIDKEKLKNNYSTWLAQLNGDFSGITDDIHQYTWTQKVNGISTYVDCNYIYNLNILN